MYKPPQTEETKKHCCSECGRSMIDTSKRISIGANFALIDGVQYRLSPQLCVLLRVLTRTTGETIHRDVIYGRLWGVFGEADPKTLDVLISKLRHVLKAAPIELHPERGVGYRLTLKPEARKNAGTEDHRIGRQRVSAADVADHRAAHGRRRQAERGEGAQAVA